MLNTNVVTVDQSQGFWSRCRNDFDRCSNAISNAVSDAWRTGEAAVEIGSKSGILPMLGFLACFAITFGGQVQAAVALPDMPVDFADYATAGMTVVGVVLGAIAGIVVVVKLTQMGLKKLGSAFSGKA